METIANLPLYALLPMLAVIAFVQNMAFTWVSRSRNSGDPEYHRKAAYCSNGIWFFTQVLIFGALWSAVTTGSFYKIAIVGIVYILATTEGSVFMMRKLLKTESGKRRVGSR